MKFNIRGNKLEVTDAIKNYVESKLGKLDKYFGDTSEMCANVVVSTKGISQRVEVTIPIKKIILRAEESNKDLYAAIDLVSEKLERQIRKNKTRIKNRSSKEIIETFVDFEINEEEEIENTIVKRKVIDSKPMNEEEAILQMNLLGHDFFIFKNVDTDNVAVIYKRKDSDYGLIEIK